LISTEIKGNTTPKYVMLIKLTEHFEALASKKDTSCLWHARNEQCQKEVPGRLGQTGMPTPCQGANNNRRQQQQQQQQ